MLQMASVFNDDQYKEKALTIAANCERSLDSSSQIDDLINGSSGILLGLLHLYEATGEKEIYKKIERYTKHLISRATIDKEGLYWDRSTQTIKGLCGFSHGAGGIGYVFLQLGRYFNNPTCYWVAEQAFAYENAQFDNTKNNWPDYRKGFYDEKTWKEHQQLYKEGNKLFFEMPGDMAAWCHGAPGIGLSRISATEITKSDQYKTDLENALLKTYSTTVNSTAPSRSFNLCHGGGGNALLFFEANRVNRDTKYQEWITSVANQALLQKQESGYYLSGFSAAENKEDNSLFMGKAGVGYFYLLASESTNDDQSTIMKPDVPAKVNRNCEEVLNIDNQYVNTIFSHKLFPKTWQHSKENNLLPTSTHNLPERFLEDTTSRLEKIVNESSSKELKAVWEFEKMKLNLDLDQTNHSYLHIQGIIEREKNEVLIGDHQKLIKSSLYLPEHCVLGELPITGQENEEYCVLIGEALGVEEIPFNTYSYCVLEKFVNATKVSIAIEQIIEDFDLKKDDEIEQVRNSTIQQIEEFLKTGILYQLDSKMT